MCKVFLKYGAAAIMAVAVPAAFGQSGQSGQQSGQQPSQRHENQNQSSARPGERGESREQANRSGQQAPDGYLFLEEQTVYLMANEPQQHFLQAHADFARSDWRAAAEETRMAAAFLDMQAARDRNDGQQDQQALKDQAHQLRQMARQLEQPKGQNNNAQPPFSLQHLDQSFARASEALAKHFDSLTKSELQRQRYIAAGYDLNATASSFKNAIVWSDAKPSKDDMTMISNAQEVAANLRNNEIYQGKEALTQEQKQWNKENNPSNAKTNGKEEQNEAGQPRQAGAHLPAGVTNSPLTGTTPAEARNDAEHATKIADALGQAIDQYGSKIQSQKPEQEQTGQPTQKENPNKGESQHPTNNR